MFAGANKLACEAEKDIAQNESKRSFRKACTAAQTALCRRFAAGVVQAQIMIATSLKLLYTSFLQAIGSE